MKMTLLATTLALSSACTAAFAQAPAQTDSAQQNTGLHVAQPHKAAMRIGRELNLSPDQTARLEPILADRQQKVMALRSDTSLSDAQRKKQLHTVQTSARLQMANVLSPDQMKQLKGMRHKRNETTAPMNAGV